MIPTAIKNEHMVYSGVGSGVGYFFLGCFCRVLLSRIHFCQSSISGSGFGFLGLAFGKLIAGNLKVIATSNSG